MTNHISLVRDRDAGYVYVDRDTGRPRVRYSPSIFDRAHLMEGVIALARICHATGAVEIRTSIPGAERVTWRRQDSQKSPDSTPTATDANDADFEAWLTSLRRAGNRAPEAFAGSAHQMGSCRMSTTEADGVVDPRGRVWGVENLQVTLRAPYFTFSAVLKSRTASLGRKVASFLLAARAASPISAEYVTILLAPLPSLRQC